MAELEVEKQGPAKANAIEHFGEDVHVRNAILADGQTQYLDDWALSSEQSHTKSRPGGPRRGAANHFANGNGKNRDFAETPAHSLDPRRPASQQEQSMRSPLLSAATVLMAGAAIATPAQSADLPKGAARNIVLVHGAFVDQTSWKPVADILTKKGYNVTLVENPLTSLAADVDATKQALAKQDGRTVLVGHSWGGVVITEAGNDPKVSALVYVSAFAPTWENLWRRSPRAVRQPKAPRRFIPTKGATSPSIPRCFPRRSRLTFLQRLPNPWQTPSFR